MTQKRRLIYHLNRARHTMMKSMDAECKRALDISVVQLSALMVLDENSGCLMKDLASALMLDRSAVTGLARRMQEGGFIERVSCAEDTRAARLEITEKGSVALTKGLGLLSQANTEIASGFTERELDTVSRFLNHIASHFSKEDSL